MLRKVFSNLFSIHSVIGVDVELASESRLISSCKLNVRGTMLSATDSHSGLKSVLHFAKQYGGGPVALNVRGKGVLTRKLEKLDEVDQQALHRILPNASLKDFYCQLVQTSQGATLSLIRKKEADALIAEFSSNGHDVIAFTLDGLAENAAYRAGFELLVNEHSSAVQSDRIAAARLQARAKARLAGIGVISGPLLLLLLISNFFAFTHYSALSARCTLQSNSSATQVAKLKSMESQLQQRGNLIRQVGWTAGLRYGFLTDRLISGMPAQVALQEFAVNPVDTKHPLASGMPSYHTSTVRISGNCADATELNNWLFSLKSGIHVQSCTIDNYVVNKDSGRGQFSITINLSDDKL